MKKIVYKSSVSTYKFRVFINSSYVNYVNYISQVIILYVNAIMNNL